jgi:hypothetical protein
VLQVYLTLKLILPQIDVQSAEDIQVAFQFARETGIALSIKASGHDYKGRSGTPGSLSLWVNRRSCEIMRSSADPACSSISIDIDEKPR